MKFNIYPNNTVLQIFFVTCLVIAGSLAFWLLLNDNVSTTTAKQAATPQAPDFVEKPLSDTVIESNAPALTAITLPTLEQQQAKIEAARKAERAAAMERDRIEKENALNRQRERERRQRKAEEKQQLESSVPSVREDNMKDVNPPQTQTPVICPEPDRIASASSDERYNTLISNKIPGSNNPEGGTCKVRLSPR